MPRWLLLTLLALPRVARLAHPQIWIEDESYLTGAFQMLVGRVPYRDIPMAHFPVLEGALAAIISVAPASIRTAEVVTQAATFGGALLVHALGRMLAGPGAGIVAALLFSTASVVFRYHVFEREIFVILPVLLATWLVLRNRGTGRTGGHEVRQGLLAGLLLSAAVAVKLSALPYVVVLAGFLAAIERRRVAALVLTGTVLGLLVLGSLVCYAIGGDAFIVQVYLFRRAIPGAPSIWVRVDDLRNSLDVPLALGLVGIGWMALTGRLRAWSLPLALLACPVLTYVILNVTYWSHNGIELLPWLSLFAGAWCVEAWSLLRGSPAALPSAVPARRLTRPKAVAAVACVAALLAFVVPIRNLNWGLDSFHGFGYRDRSEIATMADIVRVHSAPDELVTVPPLIAFEANRLELVTYPELAGMLRTLEEETARIGYWRVLKGESQMRRHDFWESVAATKQAWLPLMAEMIATGRTPVVINTSPEDLFPVPLIDVPEETLRRYGYARAGATAHYTAWVAPR